MRRVTRLLKNRQHRLLAMLLVVGMTSLCLGIVAPKVSAADCDDNAIIKCGFNGDGPNTRAQNFIKTVRSNNSGNGHSDLIAIYKEYGLEPSLYDQFASSAKQGVADTSGRIIVDGQTVGTNANSIGRLASYQGSGYFRKSINGVVYYGNSNAQAFASNNLPVTVLFNAKGVAIFAVLNSCGNPEGFTPNAPTYTCNNLQQHPVAGQPGTFSFTTSAAAGNGATITSLVYDFGDGTKMTTKSASQAVTHTYATTKSYTVTVTVNVSLPGGGSASVGGAGSGCATVVKVQLPYFTCDELDATRVGSSKYQYKFTVMGQAGNGDTLSSADIDFGDGQTKKAIAVSGGAATYTYTYTKDGSYTAKALFHVTTPSGQKVTSYAGCTKVVPVAIPYYSCVQFTGTPINGSTNQYTFKATGDAGNGETFTKADISFGDSQDAKGLVPNGNDVTVAHTYATAGQYHIVATLYFNEGKTVKSATCTANITQPGQPSTPECKPGVAQGSVLCTPAPCATNSALPADSPQCSLPNTGAGDVIAIFGAVVVAGFLLFRQFVYRKQAVDTTGGLAVPGVISAATDDNEVVSQVIAQHHATQHPHHAEHRNAKPLSHATYRRPHRFRPRSHTDKHD